jgi:hypothetical protein
MRRLTLETVAGFLEVSQIDDAEEIVIKCTHFKKDENGASIIVLSPRQARHLSGALMMYAEEADERRQRPEWFASDRQSSKEAHR